MRGYQCDNCRDFVPEVIREASGIFVPIHAGGIPSTWIHVEDGDRKQGRDFCSAACVVAAWAEREARTTAAA